MGNLRVTTPRGSDCCRDEARPRLCGGALVAEGRTDRGLQSQLGGRDVEADGLVLVHDGAQVELDQATTTEGLHDDALGRTKEGQLDAGVGHLEGPAVVADGHGGHHVGVAVDAGCDRGLVVVVALELGDVDLAVPSAVEELRDLEVVGVLGDGELHVLARDHGHDGALAIDHVEVTGHGQGHGGLADVHLLEAELAGLRTDDGGPGGAGVDDLGDAGVVVVEGLAEVETLRGEVQDVVPAVVVELGVDVAVGAQSRREDHAVGVHAANDAVGVVGQITHVGADVEGAVGLVVADVAVGAGVEQDVVAHVVVAVHVHDLVGRGGHGGEESEEGQDLDLVGMQGALFLKWTRKSGLLLYPRLGSRRRNSATASESCQGICAGIGKVAIKVKEIFISNLSQYISPQAPGVTQ
jgi:hypothetical protein